MQGKLNGHAIRVPMLNSSITDMVFIVGRDTTKEEVNAMLKAASEPGSELAETGEHGAILGYETTPLVSTDYVNDTRSARLVQSFSYYRYCSVRILKILMNT